ncbi:Uncharacterized protein APZ42_021375 [Daphnia magna]|uniref:Uncharacterized protein n=1 Tax=Daphnia magna TaxID=35525 RepID=A0A0P6CV64_9CRUS|nr:Uncharacterized protein APZ42_021375 [Daphnia magna]
MPGSSLRDKRSTMFSIFASSASEISTQTSEIRQLRDGLFCIPWNDRTSTGRRAITDLGRLKEKILSCVLNYYDDLDGTGVTLEMRIQLTEATKPQEMLVYATKDGIQQKMTFGDCWTACWEKRVTLCACGGCTSELCCEDCGEPRQTFGFEVLIDLTPNNGSTSVKEGKLHVLQHLSNLWKDKTLSDVTFHCGEGKSIKAHTLIVSSASPTLAAMCQNGFEKGTDRIIPIKLTKAHIFENLLRYIYTGEVVAEEDADLEELLIAAKEYAVESLKQECAARLSRYLTVANATRYLITAHKNNSPKLHEAALDFMSKNARAVSSRPDWLDMMKTFPELRYQTTQLMLGL